MSGNHLDRGFAIADDRVVSAAALSSSEAAVLGDLEIFSIEPKQIERIEERFAARKKEFVELRPTLRIETDDLSV